MTVIRGMTHAEKIAALSAMVADGRFHHATHRIGNGLFDGLWIYKKNAKGFRGYSPAFAFFDSDPDATSRDMSRARQDEAYAIVRHTGVSVGAYGQG